MELDTIVCSDALDYLKPLPDDSVDCCVTSVPYFGLRDYKTGHWEGGDPDCEHRNGNRVQVAQTKHPNAAESIINGPNRGGGKTCVKCGAVRVDGQIGLEESPQEYIAKIVAVFEEVRRVLKPTGTCWLNIGDSYPSVGHKKSSSGFGTTGLAGGIAQEHSPLHRENNGTGKHKDRMLMPARLAIALQDAGWWVRSEIVWFKKNCMPSSAEDRPTDSHEMLYLLTKRARYWSDFTAIREPAQDWGVRNRSGFRNGTTDPLLKHHGLKGVSKQDALGKRQYTGFNGRWDNRETPLLTRNVRSVWEIAPEPSNYQYCGACNSLFKGNGRASCPVCREKAWIDHFAAFPSRLVERCILAGCPAQVCAACGKPYERVVEKEFVPQTDVSLERGMKNADGSRPLDASNTWSEFPRGTTTIHTLGWRPTCKCENAGIDAGVVLDPFMGSGTTALAARRLGRHFIGCDLSEAYVKLATARLAEAYTLPLFPDL